MTESISDIVKKGRKKNAARVAPDVDRLPPHDIEAEQGVLSCCLQAPQECLGACIERLRVDGPLAFFDLRHQTIYNVLREMYDEQAGIDLITVMSRLKLREALDQVGGVDYLNTLQDAVPSPAMLSDYLKLLLEKFKLRRLVKTCAEITDRVYAFEGDVEKLLVECEAEISKLTEEETAQTEQHIRVVMQGVIADMEQWHYSRGSQQIRGLPTGPTGVYLDKILMGIRDTHYVTIAGRPGEGKSSFAMNVVEYLATDYVWRKPTGNKILKDAGEGEPPVEVDETVEVKGIPVGVFTIEMDNESLGYRLLFGRAGVSEAKFNQGFAVKGTHEKLAVAAAQLAATNIYLDDSTGQSINQIAA